MSIFNIITSLLLIAISIFVYSKKEISITFKTLFIYLLTLVLMIHFLFLNNLYLFQSDQIVYKDQTFIDELNTINNTDTNIHFTDEF